MYRYKARGIMEHGRLTTTISIKNQFYYKSEKKNKTRLAMGFL